MRPKQWKNIGVTNVYSLFNMAIDAPKLCFVPPIYAFGCFSYLLIVPLYGLERHNRGQQSRLEYALWLSLRRY